MLSSEKTVLSLRGVVQVKASQGADVGLQVQGGEKCDVAIRRLGGDLKNGEVYKQILGSRRRL